MSLTACMKYVGRASQNNNYLWCVQLVGLNTVYIHSNVCYIIGLEDNALFVGLKVEVLCHMYEVLCHMYGPWNVCTRITSFPLQPKWEEVSQQASARSLPGRCTWSCHIWFPFRKNQFTASAKKQEAERDPIWLQVGWCLLGITLALWNA